MKPGLRLRPTFTGREVFILPDNRMNSSCGKEPVCICTRKIYDACRSQDCLEDLRVLLTAESASVLERAINVKPKTASILWTYIDVEPVPFNDGFYTVDAKLFYRITADAFCGVGRPTELEGLATFDKRAILYGSDGRSKTFSSQMVAETGEDIQLRPYTNLPIATIEVIDPIVLSTKIVDPCDHFCGSDCCSEVPDAICSCFRTPFCIDCSRKLFVTLGQFSIMRLERDAQLLIQGADYCVPEKECPGTVDGDVCDMSARFHFPVNEFFPPDTKGGDCGCKKG
jgi:hypothetical protein